MTFQQLITMWHCGDQSQGVPSICLLKTGDFTNVLPRAKHVLCAMRYLMSHVERASKEANCWEADPRMWTKAKVLRLYDMVNHRFKYKYKRECRFYELAWMTIKNKVYYNKGRLVGEAEPVQTQPPSRSVVVRRARAAQ